MARLIKADQNRPYKITPDQFPADGKSIWICACGLTKTWPFCDKTHVACDTEEQGKTYVYNPDGTRLEQPGE